MRHLLFKLLILMVFSGYGAIASATTFNVTSADGGNVTNSLHAAIILANASASDDTIEFSGSISSIVLTADLPAVTRNLTITGTGQASLTISGGGLFTIFSNRTNGVTLTISNLTLTNNKSGEGSILYNKYADFVASQITVSGVTNTSAFYGDEANTITISNSIFENNSAKLFGSNNGATPSTTTGTYTNKITVTDSSFTSNTATIFQTERYVKIDNCTFTGNNSIGNFNGLNRYQVLNSTFTNNSGTLFSFSNYHLGIGWGSFSNNHHLFDNNTFTDNPNTVINPGSNSYYDAVTTISNNTFSGNGTNWSGSPAVVSGNTIVDTTAPSISSSATASVAENQTGAIDVDAADDNTITYSISGTDAASFSINSASGVVTFNTAPDYEAKTSYTFTATATDVAGNASTQSVTITITDVDDTNPTMTITATGVTDGSTSDASTLALTFTASEATSDFELGDITVSNATLSSFNAVSSTVYTATLTPTAPGAVTIDVAAGAFTDAASNNNTAATQFNWTYLSDPTTKADVVGSIEAWTSASSNWVSSTFDAVANRLSWLDRNQDSIKTSHQGIKIHFENEVIDTVMNLTPRSKKSIVADIKNTNVTTKAIALLQGTQSALVAGSDEIRSDAQMIAVNEAARLREGLLGSLNPSFGSVLDDWSMWTAGEISIGKTDETSLSSEQKMDAQTISLGFDKPTDNDGLLGVVISIGKSNTDIGTSTTNVKSDNYALSTYRVFKQDNKPTIEAVAGLGRLNFDTTRKDGSDTLTGARNANQVFAAVTAKGEAFERNNWSITPYGKASLAYTRLEAFSESGAITALTYDKQTLKETKVYIGTDMNYLITINNGTVKPFINLEYSADLSNGSDATMQYNAGSTSYALNLDKTATNSWKLGLGADIYTKDEWNSSISYERTEAINAGYSDSLAVKVRLKF